MFLPTSSPNQRWRREEGWGRWEAKRKEEGERGKGCEGQEGGERQRERGFGGLTVTEQDPMWPSWDRLLPHILCYSLSLKYSENNTWYTLPEFFSDAKTTTMEDINYLVIMTSHPPPTPNYRSLRIDNVNCPNTSTSANQRILYMSWIINPKDAPLSSGL